MSGPGHLTPEQRRALAHAREVLTEEWAATGLSNTEWRRELRMALRDVIGAFDDDPGQEDEALS